MGLKLRLGHKLLIAFLCVGIIPLAVVGITALMKSSAALEEATFDQLRSVVKMKQAQLTDYFADVEDDIHLLGSIIDTMMARIDEDPALANDPNLDPREYLVERYAGFFRDFARNLQYHDLYLVAPNGEVIFSMLRESDYRTNLLSGPYRETHLGRMFRRALDSRNLVHADYAPYPPSDNAPTGFVGLPLIEDGAIQWVIALQLSLNPIHEVVHQREGMGTTGETYLVGPDNLRRSDSALEGASHSVRASFADPLNNSITTEATRAALAGRSDVRFLDNIDGDRVLSAFTPLRFGPHQWALIAEMDAAEALEVVADLRWVVGLIFIFGVFVIAAVAVLFTRSITVPIGKTMAMLEEIGHGRIDRRLNMERHDEIGDMARSMDAFADSLQGQVVTSLVALSRGDLTFEANPYDDKDVIGTALAKTGDDLNRIVEEIVSVSEQIAASADQVSSASQSLSQGATESAASLEQITSSIAEIAAQTKINAENSTQANQLAMDARRSAETGNAQMEQLMVAMREIRQAGQAISKIIKVIDEIAFQTNLLALNAGVEAVRAGRHGKGFAVVAEEVRNMAVRSAKAARETAELIEGSVQKTETGAEIAGRTADSLQAIVGSISKASDLVSDIASSSNEQALGISQVNEGLRQIDQVTQTNAANAEEGAAAAEELASQADHLQGLVATFTLKEPDGNGQNWGPPPRSGRGSPHPHSPPRTGRAMTPTSGGPDRGRGWWDGSNKPRASIEPPRKMIALDDDEEFRRF